jgi:hypothetical protein
MSLCRKTRKRRPAEAKTVASTMLAWLRRSMITTSFGPTSALMVPITPR